MGEGLEAVCRDPAMPCLGTVYGWMRRHPELLEDYRRAKALMEEVMLELACEGLPWIGERRSWPMLRRTVRATEKAAARLSLQRYAPAAGPETLRVELEAADGSVTETSLTTHVCRVTASPATWEPDATAAPSARPPGPPWRVRHMVRRLTKPR